MFGALSVWDTEENCGVLVYLLLADRDVEIVADRGIHAKVGDEAWVAICREMEAAFRERRFEEGVVAGIARINALLAEHFPRTGAAGSERAARPAGRALERRAVRRAAAGAVDADEVQRIAPRLVGAVADHHEHHRARHEQRRTSRSPY